jgi:hypothetical protein
LATSRITPAAFDTRADAVCADYRARVARLHLPSAGDLAGIYRVAVATLAIARLEVAKLHALPLPSANRALTHAWLATRDRLLVLLEQLRDAAKKKDAVAVGRVVAALNANGAEAHRLARSLGMKVCSLGG